MLSCAREIQLLTQKGMPLNFHKNKNLNKWVGITVSMHTCTHLLSQHFKLAQHKSKHRILNYI